MSAVRPYRHLVACSHCGLQFDASGRAPGSRFRCACGEAIEVPAPEAHDAAVVRCSACAAPREGAQERCSFCGSDFSLHERDLHTICPGCATRISDRSRYCHRCGLTIAPQALAGEPTRFSCPTCGEARRLRSRSLAGEPVTVLECEACAGIWLGSEVFRRLEAKAAESQTEDETRPDRVGGPRVETPVYRPCPECRKLMHRRNYGRKSGVIVDTCGHHGIWFDAGELESVLGWVRSGGPRRVRARETAEQMERARHARLFPAGGMLDPEPPKRTPTASLAEFVLRIVEVLRG